jgi:uncharacterized repeat protein (TIGR02543 family)
LKIATNRYLIVVLSTIICSLLFFTSCNSGSTTTTVAPAASNVAPLTPQSNSSQVTNAQAYTLTIATNGQGNTSPGSGSYTMAKDQSVLISANPVNGWKFDGWTGDASGNNLSITLTMNGKKGVTANFSPIVYSLITSINGNGTINPTAGSKTYNSGTNVNLSASPSSGWKFDGWGVDASGSSTSISIIIDSNKTVVANFSRVTYILTINVKGNGTTDPSPGGHSSDSGSSITLTATPSGGYQFAGWTGDIIASPSSTTVTMDSDKNITANFLKPPVSGHLNVNISISTGDFPMPTMSQGDKLDFNFTVAGADVYYSVLDPAGNKVLNGNGGNKTSSGQGSVVASTPGVFKLHFVSTGIITPSVLSIDYTVSYPLR